MNKNDLKFYGDAGDLGGTGYKYYFKNSSGEILLFKPAIKKLCFIKGFNDLKAKVENGEVKCESFRCEAQSLAALFQKMITPDTFVECETVVIDGIQGTLQPIISRREEDLDELSNYDNKTKGPYSNEEKNIARQFLKYYVIDFLLADYDSKYGNFIIDTNGSLRRIDTEQALRFINKGPDLRFEHHPNAKYGERSKPIYGKIFNDVESGKISSEILDEIKVGISIVSKLSEEDYLKMFESYINSLKEARIIDENGASQKRIQIMERRRLLLEEVPKMIDGIKSKALSSTLGGAASEFDNCYNSIYKHT